MRRLQVALVASMLAIPGGTFAQGLSVSADSGAQISPPRSLIVVGPLRRGIDREAVRLADSPTAASPAQGTQRERNWAGRHPVFLGAVIGLGVGLAINATDGCQKSSDYTCTQQGLVLGGLFAGIGAGVGGVVGLILR